MPQASSTQRVIAPLFSEFVSRRIPLVTNRHLVPKWVHSGLLSPIDAQRFAAPDTWHPSRDAHSLLAALVLNLLMRGGQRGATNVTCVVGKRRTIGGASSQCKFGESLLHGLYVARHSAGWDYVVEAKGKAGLVTKRVGAVLSLAIAGLDGPLAERQLLQVGYLSSYEHMGYTTWSCSGACSCRGFTLNGNSLSRVSLTQLSPPVWVVPRNASFDEPHGRALRCRLQARVTPQTDSGEHKFKVVGLVLQTVQAVEANEPRAFRASLQAAVGAAPPACARRPVSCELRGLHSVAGAVNPLHWLVGPAERSFVPVVDLKVGAILLGVVALFLACCCRILWKWCCCCYATCLQPSSTKRAAQALPVVSRRMA